MGWSSDGKEGGSDGKEGCKDGGSDVGFLPPSEVLFDINQDEVFIF